MLKAIPTFFEIGDVWRLGGSFYYLALAIAGLDDVVTAVTLCAVTKKQYELIGQSWYEKDQIEFDAFLAGQTQKLPAAVYENAWQRGLHMPLKEAVALCLQL